MSDYVEKLWSQAGGSRKVVDRIARTGIYTRSNFAALEIGAGTGRYIEKVLAIAGKRIRSYESYETDPGWSTFLDRTFPVTSRPADGHSLSETGDHSIDFVAAHGVFVYTSFLTTMSYLMEIARVAAAGAVVAADFYTEDCMTEELLGAWLRSAHKYPHIMPFGYISEFLSARGFTLIDSFHNAYGEGFSKYLVFERTGPV